MIAVTGATGHFGRLAIEGLLDGGVAPGRIVAAVRTPEKAADLAARGVQVRQADYDRPETLGPALAGVGKLLLVSSSEVGKRVGQHRNMVKAAVDAGVGLVAYTSILRADSSHLALAREHRETEAIIRHSGLPYVLLRNGWYVENYTENLGPALQTGTFIGAAGDGEIAAATRADYAAAAAAVLLKGDHANTIYELGGDVPFTMAGLAAEVSRQVGKEIGYQNLPADEYAKILASAGVPEAFAGVLADSDLGIARGELTTTSGHLHCLIGRATTPLADAVAMAVKAM